MVRDGLCSDNNASGSSRITLSMAQHSGFFESFRDFLESQCGLHVDYLTIAVSTVDKDILIDCHSTAVDVKQPAITILPLDESPYPSNVDVAGKYIMGSSQRRRYRRGLWTSRLDDLASADGYCYLWAFRHKYRKDVALSLGPYPTFWTVISHLTDKNYDVSVASKYRVVSNVTYNGSRAMHLCCDPVSLDLVDHGSFHEVLSATCLDFDLSINLTAASLNRGGAIGVQSTAVLGTTVSSAIVQSVISLNETNVRNEDGTVRIGAGEFSHCKCEIHKPPLISDEFGCGIDSDVAKGSGTVSGRGNYYCHASPDVRGKDLLFQSALRGYKVGSLSIHAARDAVHTLKSAKGADVSVFGVGYCYLGLILPKFRWRVARVVGPNPSLNDVYLLSQLVGMQKTVAFTLQVNNPHHCHFVVGPRVLMEQLDELLYAALTSFPGLIVI